MNTTCTCTTSSVWFSDNISGYYYLNSRLNLFCLTQLEQPCNLCFWKIIPCNIWPQLTSWLEELQQELQSSDIADTVEGAETLLAQFNQQRETTIEAAINTVSEGENLLEQIR